MMLFEITSKSQYRWIGLVIILGFIKWQYPEETSMISSGFGGLITVLIAFYLIFNPLIGSKGQKADGKYE